MTLSRRQGLTLKAHLSALFLLSQLNITELRADGLQAYDSPRYLEPEDGVFADSFFSGYYVAVARALVPKLEQAADFSVVVLPSFSPEWALSIDLQKGRVTSAHATKSIWESGSTDKSVVLTASFDLPRALSRRVVALGIGHLGKVQYSSSSALGLDGVTYHFFGIDRGREIPSGIRSGKTWSPSADSAVGQLVAVVELCDKAAFAKDNERALVVERLKDAVANAESMFSKP